MSLIDDFYLPEWYFEAADLAQIRGHAQPRRRAPAEPIAIQRLVSFPACSPTSAPSPPSSC